MVCPKTRPRENPPGALPVGMWTLPRDSPNWYQYRVIERHIPVAVMALELRSLPVLSGSASAFPGLRWTLGGCHTVSCSSRNQGVSPNLDGDEKGIRRQKNLRRKETLSLVAFLSSLTQVLYELFPSLGTDFLSPQISFAKFFRVPGFFAG